MKIRLKEGVGPEAAAMILRTLSNEWSNLLSQGGTHPDDYRHAYVRRAYDVELQLRNLSFDPELVTVLQTDRYWQLHSMPPGNPMRVIVNAEVEYQRDEFRRLAESLEERAKRLKASPGWPTVLDTNVLLHYQRPDYINWPEVVGQKKVRLILPLRVVEELDTKKYTSSEKLAQVARGVLRWLEQTLGPGSIGPVAIRDDGTTIEVLVDDPPRVRPAHADEEILSTAADLKSFIGHSPTLVTGDTTVKVLASAAEIDVKSVPDKWLRKPLPPDGSA